MPLTNDKWRCNGCGGIYHFDSPAEMTVCPNCGPPINYDQIVIQQMCDFCGIHDSATVAYPCEDFETENGPNLPDTRYNGGWAACPECAAAIDANDRSELATRAVRVAIEKEPGLNLIGDILFSEIRGLHDEFFNHRTGDPTPIEEEVPHG